MEDIKKTHADILAMKTTMYEILKKYQMAFTDNQTWQKK